jgi:quercetin 2,3-dioxygenase
VKNKNLVYNYDNNNNQQQQMIRKIRTMAPTIKHIPSNKLFVSEPDPSWFGNDSNDTSNPTWTNKNWLKSRFHFSFAEYNNDTNSNFGVLRVMNDDLVQPDRGFGTHPHRNMEIITYVVDGELTHKDSMGTSESLGRGSIQFMSAGTGVRHSEYNASTTKPLRFIQTWIIPSKMNLEPKYGSFSPNSEKCIEKDTLLHLVSNVEDKSSSTPVEINQDVDGYASVLELGKTVVHKLPQGRQGYLLCLEGTIQVNGTELKRYDACEITGDSGTLTVEATGTEMTADGEVAHFIMFTMKAVPGDGRKDF